MKTYVGCEPTKWDGLIYEVTLNNGETETINLPPDFTLRGIIILSGSVQCYGSIDGSPPKAFFATAIAGNFLDLSPYPVYDFTATANNTKFYLTAWRPFRLTVEHFLRQALQAYEQVDGVAIGQDAIKVKVQADWVNQFTKPTTTSASCYTTLERFRALIYDLFGIVLPISVNSTIEPSAGFETNLDILQPTVSLTEPADADGLLTLLSELRQATVAILRWAYIFDELKE